MKNRFDPDQSLYALSNIFDESSDASARLIADAIPQIVWVADPDGNVEYCNRAWLDFSGLTFEESLGQGWESALHPDVQTLELMAGLLGAAIAQQVHIQSNERLLAERADALSALQAEIENRLRSEQQLREAEQRTRVLLESSHDAFFSMSSEGVIVDWNGQSESLFGWLRQEAAGKQFAALLIPEHARPGLSAELEQIIGSIETPAFKRRIELTALHRLGSSISIELSISSIRDGAEQLAYVFIRDIGRHK
jgi:PAS domain S-box-containing protein